MFWFRQEKTKYLKSFSSAPSGLPHFLRLHDSDPVRGEISRGLQSSPQGSVVSELGTKMMRMKYKGDSSYEMLLERHFKV